MSNETPNRVHAGGLFVATDPIPAPFTDAIVASQGVAGFERLDVGQYRVTFQRPLAFHEGYAEGHLPANFQAMVGAQILEDGSGAFFSVLGLAAGEPVDPPVIGCTVWSVREGEGDGPAIAVPAVPPPVMPGAGVTSFNGRMGAVVSVAGDYAASQVTDDSGVGGGDVAGALDILQAAIALNTGDIAINAAAITSLAATVAGLTSSNIANASGVAGGAGSVTTALEALRTKTMWFTAETNANNSGHRVRNVGASGNFDFNFVAPADFGTLVRLEMWGASRTCTNPAAAITLTSSYGTPPESPTFEGAGQGITPAFVAGQLFLYSVAGVFGNLSAGDQCGVNVNHGGIGGSIDYYGVYMEYLSP